jgi:hypothetical protein
MSAVREVSFTLLCVGGHLAIRVLLIGTTRKWTMKPLGLDLHARGGHLSLLGPMERYFPMLAHGDPYSTQILTQHRIAMSQTVNQLMNTGTTPTRQVLG